MKGLPPNPKRPGFMQQKTHSIEYIKYSEKSIVSQRNSSYDHLLLTAVSNRSTFKEKDITIKPSFSNMNFLINQSNEALCSQQSDSYVSLISDDCIDMNLE
eukprot:EST43394.1 Hypothetical protein SS50377_17075 [Spironucleus salmonicida]